MEHRIHCETCNKYLKTEGGYKAHCKTKTHNHIVHIIGNSGMVYRKERILPPSPKPTEEPELDPKYELRKRYRAAPPGSELEKELLNQLHPGPPPRVIIEKKYKQKGTGKKLLGNFHSS